MLLEQLNKRLALYEGQTYESAGIVMERYLDPVDGYCNKPKFWFDDLVNNCLVNMGLKPEQFYIKYDLDLDYKQSDDREPNDESWKKSVIKKFKATEAYKLIEDPLVEVLFDHKRRYQAYKKVDSLTAKKIKRRLV